MMADLLAVAGHLCDLLIWLWVVGLVAQTFPRAPRMLVTIKQEIHPFYPYIVLASLAINVGGYDLGQQVIAYLGTAFMIYVWYRFGGDDDDRWKRRRRRAAARIRSLGHRLTVEPA